MRTLLEAKEEVKDAMKDGIECPCCEQWTQLYKYSFHSGMVKALIYIYKAYENGDIPKGEFFHVEKYLKEKKVDFHGYHSKLKFWGLLEQKSNDNPAKKWSGFWKITQKGIDFIKDEIALPKYVWLHNKKAYGFEGPNMLASELKFKHFNYAEMMGAE